MGYVVHFNTYPSVVGAEIHRKVTILYDKNCLLVCKTKRSTTPSVIGETVGSGVMLHVAALSAIYCTTWLSNATPSTASPIVTLHLPASVTANA